MHVHVPRYRAVGAVVVVGLVQPEQYLVAELSFAGRKVCVAHDGLEHWDVVGQRQGVDGVVYALHTRVS